MAAAILLSPSRLIFMRYYVSLFTISKITSFSCSYINTLKEKKRIQDSLMCKYTSSTAEEWRKEMERLTEAT